MPKKKKKKEELEIDLTKLFVFFKGLNKLFKFRGKNKESEKLVLAWKVALILIPLLIAMYFRMAPASLPITDDWAKDTVYANIKNALLKDIYSKYPNLIDEEKEKLLDKNFQEVLKEQADLVQTQIDSTSKLFKERMKNENGYTYLLAIDPYAYYRRARNIIEKGHYWDTIKNGRPWNDHMIAPIGQGMKFNLHYYIIAYWHKFLSLFGVKDLMGSAFFIPIIFSALSVIPAFYLGKRFSNDIGGFVAAMITAVSSPFISRTAGGFVDTDAYNVLFPLLIAWLFIEAMERKTILSKIIFSSLAGICVGIFSLIWEWWFIFDLVLIVIVSFFGFNLIKPLILKKGFRFEKWVKDNLYAALFFILSSGIFVSLSTGFINFLTYPFKKPLSYYFYKAVVKGTIWPNIITTVAEQAGISVDKAINALGGTLLFYVALLGIYWIPFGRSLNKKQDRYTFLGGAIWLLLAITMLKPSNVILFELLIFLPFIIKYIMLLKKKERAHIEFSVLTLVWLLISFFAAVRGVRFTLLVVPVIALGFGVAIGRLFRELERVLSKSLGIEEGISKIILSLFVVVILISPTIWGYKTAVREIPSMNDAWFTALTKIKENSNQDAIINSWWDFGHWFKAIANRAVTFDGASQNTPMAHWIGLSLLTSNENLTLGILRMLDCGSNTAFEVLNNETNDPVKTINLLYKIITQKEGAAKEILTKASISPATIEKTLKLTHCKAPEDFYITSEDMIGKSGVWAHFGSWNFTKATMYREVKNKNRQEALTLLEKEYNFSKNDALRIYSEIKNTNANDWIAPWPSYISNDNACQKVSQTKMLCGHRFSNNNIAIFNVNLTNMDVSIDTPQGRGHPELVVYPTSDGYGTRQYKDNILKGVAFSLLPPEGPGKPYRSVLSAPEIATSTFHKLFFYNGLGMHCFKLFDNRTQFTGGRISVWKVDWNCTN